MRAGRTSLPASQRRAISGARTRRCAWMSQLLSSEGTLATRPSLGAGRHGSGGTKAAPLVHSTLHNACTYACAYDACPRACTCARGRENVCVCEEGAQAPRTPYTKTRSLHRTHASICTHTSACAHANELTVRPATPTTGPASPSCASP